ncbi:hypothetical protein KSS87_020894 [Heliosperma pusillum]|nr:hypothetical protein KSS87_020894 [Heliosperma pusillum]
MRKLVRGHRRKIPAVYGINWCKDGVTLDADVGGSQPSAYVSFNDNSKADLQQLVFNIDSSSGRCVKQAVVLDLGVEGEFVNDILKYLEYL